MKNCESLNELKEWLDYGYNVSGKRNFSDSSQIAAYLLNEYEYLLHEGQTDRNCFLVILGKQIVENCHTIHWKTYRLIEHAVRETMHNCAAFELTETEKEEICQLAKEVGEMLPSLQIEGA